MDPVKTQGEIKIIIIRLFCGTGKIINDIKYSFFIFGSRTFGKLHKIVMSTMFTTYTRICTYNIVTLVLIKSLNTLLTVFT